MHELHNLMDTSDAVSGLHENWQAHSDYALFPCCIECRRGLAIRKVSVFQMHALWQNGRKICPDLCTIRGIIYR